ncbi:hypothetical protein BO99DRAFT_334358, partial [Aspergillus violaceofuscus CBS 115571]
NSPSSPIKAALVYIIKGCEITLNRTALLKHKVSKLRAGLERQNTKKKRSYHQIAGLNSLTVKKAKNAFSQARKANKAIGICPVKSAADEEQPRRRAPPRCSKYRTIGYIRTRCPTHQNTK